MKKIILQLLITIGAFAGLWFGLSQIEYLNNEELSTLSEDNEKKLGDLIIDTIQKTEEEIKSKEIRGYVDSLIHHICEKNDIDHQKIKFYIVKNQEINAFALPDNNIVIYSGLLTYAKSPEEVAGVLAHEIGHIEKKHVMKKLLKEVGIAMVFTMAGGDASFEILKETARLLSSSAFDREQEREADVFAVHAMAKASIDPEHLANFLFRIAKTQELPDAMEWISTHPEGKERAAYILAESKKLDFSARPLLNSSWSTIQEKILQLAKED